MEKADATYAIIPGVASAFEVVSRGPSYPPVHAPVPCLEQITQQRIVYYSDFELITEDWRKEYEYIQTYDKLLQNAVGT